MTLIQKLSLGLIFSLLLSSCSSFNVISKKNEKKEFNFSVKKEKIYPGEAKLFKLDLEGVVSDDNFKILCNKKKVIHAYEDGMATFFVTASYFSKKKSFKCKLKVPEYKKKLDLLKFKIVKKKYPVSYLKVDRKKVFLSKKDKKRVKKERKILHKIYKNSQRELLFSDKFKMPLDSKITEYYGTKRVFNKKKKGQHLGIDFRARIGVPIPTANDGRVVFAGDLFYTGNTVIIEHGLSLYTVYGHLSKIMIKEGEKLEQGDIVGLSGNTGRVTGPHLHWGVKVAGEWVNGESLLQIDLKDVL